MTQRHLAGHAAARALRVAGVPFVAGVAGESFLPLLDGLRTEGVTFLSVGHESGATFLASAHARMTGRVAVAAVTRGPGAANALIGIHEAAQASSPVVLIVGQLETRIRGRRALQEMEMTHVFGSVAKAVLEVSRADQIAPSVLAAIRKAELPRAGPVVVSVPSDLFFEEVRLSAADPLLARPRPLAAALDTERLEEVAKLIRGARRGLLVVGAAFAHGRHAALLSRAAEATGFGVIGGHAFPDVLSSTHPAWLGTSTIRGGRSLRDTFTQADVIILLDHWLGDRVTQGYLPLRARITAIVGTSDVGWDEYLDAEIVVASPVAALAQIAEAAAGHQGRAARSQWVAARRAALQAERERILGASDERTPTGRVPFRAIVETLDACLPREVVLVSDAGSFNDWILRYLPFGEGRSYLGTLSGSMGSAIPGALGVQLAGATRTVALVGDGGFLMTGLEVATVARLGSPVTILVFRNDVWGSIAIHQDRHFPDRRFGTELPGIAYAELAAALSIPGHRATTREELAVALRSGFTRKGPSLVEIATDAELPSPASYEANAPV